jgi:adenine phosphoribosyltransferase
MEQFKSKIREIEDWPKVGVNFKDFTPLLGDRVLFRKVIDIIAKPYLKKKIDKVIGIEARGFLLAPAIAYKLKSGIAIVRKKGKLPYITVSKTISKECASEYGNNTIEMHSDSILPNEKVLLVDDLLATGGTMEAAIELVEKLKGKIVEIVFLIETESLKGRKKLKGHKIRSLIKYNK